MPNDHSLPLASRVPETALCGEDMDLLSKIHGDSISNDNVFLSVARMLYEPKMGPDDKMSIKFAQVRPGSGWPESQENRGIVEHFMPFTGADSIAIISLYGSEESNKPIFEAVTHLPEFSPGWEENKKLGLFLEGSKFRARVFTSAATKSVLVIGERIDTMRAHVLGAAASFLCPWYRNKEVDQPFCTEHLFPSLLESQTPDAFLALCKEIQEERYDIRGVRIERLIGGANGFENRAIRANLDRETSNINRYENKIGELLASVADYREKINASKATRIGYERFLSENRPGEMAGYFKSCQGLELLDAGEKHIDFVYAGYMDSFSEDTEYTIDNARYNFIASRVGDKFDLDDIVALLRAVLIDRTILMRTCARIRLKFPHGVDTDYSYRADLSKYDTYMPNPHLDQFGCFGGHRDEIATLAGEGMYIDALEQCMEAVRSFDLSDSSVGACFISHLCSGDYDGYHRNNRCFELPDGSVVDTAGAIKYLKEVAA